MSVIDPLRTKAASATCLIMILVNVALFAAVGSLASPTDLEPPTAEIAAERLARCGLGPVTIRHDEEMQEEILISNVSSATDEQLACADRAAGYRFDVEMPPSIQARFAAIRESRASDEAAARARAWLESRGLLARVPDYQAGITDERIFTRQIEALCGPRATGAFQSRYGFHILNPAWARSELRAPPSPAPEVFECLSNVAIVAGFSIGFVGNEAYVR